MWKENWFYHKFLWGSCCLILSFLCSVLPTIVCLFLLAILAIVLSVLRLRASYSLSGIFKLFLRNGDNCRSQKSNRLMDWLVFTTIVAVFQLYHGVKLWFFGGGFYNKFDQEIRRYWYNDFESVGRRVLKSSFGVKRVYW